MLLSARGADVFLDTIVRFIQGDENSSTDNDQGLAAGFFRLLQSGARTVTGSAHSPKSFDKERYMSLENLLRGTGDIGAMVATVWGVRLLDRDRTLVHVENVKPRDFEPPPPFQIQGRPFIDEGKGFQMTVKPGHAPSLAEALQSTQGKGGRPSDPVKAERMKLLVELVQQRKSTQEIIEELKASGEEFPQAYFPGAGKRGTLTKELSAARKLVGVKY